MIYDVFLWSRDHIIFFCSVSQALLYHLSDVLAMSRCYEMFGVLGLATDTVREAVRCSGSFILKGSELQQ